MSVLNDCKCASKCNFKLSRLLRSIFSIVQQYQIYDLFGVKAATLGNAVAAGVKREKERPPVNWKDQGEKT